MIDSYLDIEVLSTSCWRSICERRG